MEASKTPRLIPVVSTDDVEVDISEDPRSPFARAYDPDAELSGDDFDVILKYIGKNKGQAAHAQRQLDVWRAIKQSATARFEKWWEIVKDRTLTEAQANVEKGKSGKVGHHLIPWRKQTGEVKINDEVLLKNLLPGCYSEKVIEIFNKTLIREALKAGGNLLGAAEIVGAVDAAKSPTGGE